MFKDLKNKKFHNLKALYPVGKNKWGNYIWECICDCGNRVNVPSSKLLQGRKKDCGCKETENRRKSAIKHGITAGGKPRTLIIWSGMKARCFNPKSSSYKSYGAKGITVIDEWLVFENFHKWAMKNGYKDDLEIDRIDNNGNYEPDNCHWVTKSENCKKQQKVRYIKIYDEEKSVSEWLKILKISKSVAYKYLNISDDEFIEFAKMKGQVYFMNKFLA